MRKYRLVPIRYLGHGSYGMFVSFTLNSIVKQPHIHLPAYVIRAIMKQILEGIKHIHSKGLIHRDIKCENILLHSPPGSECVYTKISDFGLAKIEDIATSQTYIKGTLPYMAPEIFKKHLVITQKVDIYALGITFYKLLTNEYPVNERDFKEQQKKVAQMKSIKRSPEIKDKLLWDLFSKLLEFDPNIRITAAEALQHPYFTSPEAVTDVSKEQQDLASLAAVAQLEGDSSITEFDKDPQYIVPKGKPNPLKEQLEKYGIVTKLLEIYNNKKISDNDWTKCQFALIFGCLFKALPIPSEFSPIVFEYLKDIKLWSDLTKNHTPHICFSLLAECEQESLKTIRKEGEGKSSEERMNIIEQGGLKDICKVIHSSLEGEMNWNKQYLISLGCEVASILLKDNKESFPFAIESGGIIDETISLLDKLPIENFNGFHLLPLQGEGNPNPLLKEMDKDGTLTKLIEIFRNDKLKDININTYAACSIGRLFKAIPIPSYIGPFIIIFLKDLSIDPDLDLSCQAIITLSFLAECACVKPLTYSCRLISSETQLNIE
ncbi:MAG: hypothetical protein EZS28_009125 [Streblomastix strix]|uniref:Protein kinase domain-containing protein n=1 Tax=Streblomastix strix TaxID=222440 RepID=A0A5J4WLT5_9EUKA|nr:MAG: hypothetical protein EZS28_009125 [Streblomastix strix]